MVWVRHRGRVHQVPLCPDTRPYTTVALMPANENEATVVNLVDGTSLTVSGRGLSEDDPMFCPELEDMPLPRCRCPEFDASDLP